MWPTKRLGSSSRTSDTADGNEAPPPPKPPIHTASTNSRIGNNAAHTACRVRFRYATTLQIHDSVTAAAKVCAWKHCHNVNRRATCQCQWCEHLRKRRFTVPARYLNDSAPSRQPRSQPQRCGQYGQHQTHKNVVYRSDTPTNQIVFTFSLNCRSNVSRPFAKTARKPGSPEPHDTVFFIASTEGKVA